MSQTLVMQKQKQKSLKGSEKSVTKPGKRRSDMIRQPANSRYNKLKVYRSKRPGGDPVTIKRADGSKRERPRRYRPITHAKRRRRYHTHSRAGQKGSTVVPARVNTFIKKTVTAITKEVGEEGTHWPAVQSDGTPTHFQCTDAFKTVVALYAAKLQEEIYDQASMIAGKKTRYKHGETDAFVQVHEEDVLVGWSLMVRNSTRGRNRVGEQQFIGIARNDDEFEDDKISRARYLSTESQRNAIKSLARVSRLKPAVHKLIDSIVKSTTKSAIELAMIKRNTQSNRVQLTREDALHGFRLMNVFPQVISAL